jgi:hypothetical protein
MRRMMPARVALMAVITGVLLAVGLAPLAASPVDPTDWTTTIDPISRDSFGNPITLTFTISGPATSYAICLRMRRAPSYNTKAPVYTSLSYTDGGKTYGPCKKFSWSSGASNTHHFGTNFAFGGPGMYEVRWFVPDIPANGGVQVGQGATSHRQQKFAWATSDGAWSYCPPDPQLQIGVWRPSRHQILNRCYTVSGEVTRGVTTSSLDSDHIWKLGSNSLQIEYVKRDWYYTTYLPSPSVGEGWVITGVYVCDLYHGWKEIHPVFRATESLGDTFLSGPQYSTATPSVSGSWTTHPCTGSGPGYPADD